MSLDIAAIQTRLAADQLDGWLLYDFHGQNPIAVHLAGLTGMHTTRRWYYLIPAVGAPTKLVHAIEPNVLDGVPGDRRFYAGHREHDAALASMLGGLETIAMEFSPRCAIPSLSRVDAGTIDHIRDLGVRVVSSGDLVGQFEAAWQDEALATHRAASEKLYRIKDETFAFAGARLAARDRVDEFTIQEVMVGLFRREGLVADARPIVAAEENAGNPHYEPTAERSRAFRAGELLLLDLWGKLESPGAVYADITWVGVSGPPSAERRQVFDAVVAGRDAAIALVTSRVAAGQPIHGWEVDRAAREVITRAGFGGAFVHRTGHSLGESVHGNGVHMDDYETHDERRLLPGTGFTIEPGIYLPTFGIRSEINMVVGPRSATVTGPCQREFVPIQ